MNDNVAKFPPDIALRVSIERVTDEKRWLDFSQRVIHLLELVISHK